MKKKLIYIFIGFVCILGITYILRYKLGDNFENKIPKNALAVFKINTRQLEHHFLIDFLTNPIIYLKPDKTIKKDSTTIKKESPSFFKAIKIPKNILFYAKDSSFNKTWISTKMKIKDVKIVTDLFISNKFKPLHIKEVNVYSKKNIKVIIKNNELIIIVNSNINTDNYHYLFSNTSFLDNTSLLLQKLKKSTSDVYYASIKNEELKGNFNKGSIEIKGNANFDFLKEETRLIDTASIGIVATTFNKDNEIFNKFITTVSKDKFKSITKLRLDSVYTKWNGSMYFNLSSFKTNIDSIKTYEYDDDFNKIEKLSTQKISNPDFILNFGNHVDLFHYLDNENTLKDIDNETVFIPIPIVKTFIKTSTNKTSLYTFKTVNKTNEKVESKLTASFNFKTYRESTINTPFYNFETIKNIQKCFISISKDNELNLKIIMKSNTRNALIQLVK